MKEDYSENTTTGKKIVITRADRDIKSTAFLTKRVFILFEGSIKMESSSYSGSSKRAKALSQMPHCLVDGCNADLGLCRDYHRRHKVCEVHSKTSRVTIGGREQRFCQQCSRFHSLVEFDDGKRSCRKRLDGHNRRRRKPQTERNSGLFHSTQQGTTLLSFGTTTQMLPSSVMGSSWTGTVKPDNNIPLYNNHPTPNYQQLQFMQGLDQDNKAKIFCDGLNKVVDSDRALSLLSTRPTMTQEFGSNRAAEPEPVPQAAHDLHYYGMNRYSFIVGQEDNLNVSSSHNDASILHFPETFHHGHKGSSSSGSHQTLTFMWE